MKDTEEILKENPGSVIFARYAEELAQKGEIDEALEILEKGIEARPYYASGHSVLADILFMQDSDEKAAEQLKATLRLDPQTPKDLLRLGKYFLKQKQPAKALPYLWAALRFEPFVDEVKNVFKEAQLLKATPGDLKLSEQSEKALSELTEAPEIEEAEVTDTEVPLEIEEDKYISGEESEAEAPEQAEEVETEDFLAHEESETSETILDETGEISGEAFEESETPVSTTDEEEAPLESFETEKALADDLSSPAESVVEDASAQTFEEEISEAYLNIQKWSRVNSQMKKNSQMNRN